MTDESVLMSVAGLVLGWLLGLLQPAITEGIRRRRESKEVTPALRVELDELRYRVAMAAYFIQMRFGKVDRTFLQWVRDQLKAYEGLNPRDELLNSVEDQLALTDEILAALTSTQKAKADGGLSVKKYTVPLIDSRVPLFWQLSPKLQRALLEIRANLDLYNEEVSRAQHYFDLTFESLSDDNHNRAVANLTGCYGNLVDRGRILVNRIEMAIAESKK